MPGQLTPAELLKLFPVEHSFTHGRSRHKKRKTTGAHGRGRHHGGHGRGKLPRSVKIDVWKHKGQARGQG